MSRVIQPHRAYSGLAAAARFVANGDAPLRLDAALAALMAVHALLIEERDRSEPDSDRAEWLGEVCDSLSHAAGLVRVVAGDDADAMQGAHR